MGSLNDDYDLLLTAPNPVEAALAKDLLAEHGIPSFTHGFDRDLADLGTGVHNAISRPNVYVPKGQRERAQAILAEAWDARPLPDDGPGAPPDANDPKWSSSADAQAEEVASQRISYWPMVLGVALIAIAFVVLWAVAGH
ncbi:MAG: DUF2007 domain-containing protein [Planctomycetes bacterium]|nr:DUF2007 domain-containing protein [Planctomycetota bacterium]